MFSKYINWLREKIRAIHLKHVIIFAGLAFLILFGFVLGVSQARADDTSNSASWWMPPTRPWWPTTPVPNMKILEVKEDNWVRVEFRNLPEKQKFYVTMGKMWTRGIDGIEVKTFNSKDGSVVVKKFYIPDELKGDYRISIRAQTDHTFPYYAFNWFYNTTAVAPTLMNDPDLDDSKPPEGEDGEVLEEEGEEGEESTDDEESLLPDEANPAAIASIDAYLIENDGEIPSFKICVVERNNTVLIVTENFPEEEEFFVKMGVMPHFPKKVPYHDGRMMMPRTGEMSVVDVSDQQHPMPPKPPMNKDKKMNPPMNWIPYFDAGSFETGGGGELEESFGIPEELEGAYRISIMMRTDHTYPYFSYNWFYNNDAEVCEEEN